MKGDFARRPDDEFSGDVSSTGRLAKWIHPRAGRPANGSKQMYGN
jgi:hypothetical protein